jgi:hypothetical protein
LSTTVFTLGLPLTSAISGSISCIELDGPAPWDAWAILGATTSVGTFLLSCVDALPNSCNFFVSFLNFSK